MNMKKANDEIIPSYVTNIFSFDITPYAKWKEFRKNELICREGDDLSDLVFLIKGNAKLFLTHENGKVTIIDFFNLQPYLGRWNLWERRNLPMESLLWISASVSCCP